MLSFTKCIRVPTPISHHHSLCYNLAKMRIKSIPIRYINTTLAQGDALLQRSMSLHNHSNILSNKSKEELKSNHTTDQNLKEKDEEVETPIDFMNKLPEELISGSDDSKPTKAENQLDTLHYFNVLRNTGFTEEQSLLVVELLLEISNKEFFEKYNQLFLKSVELDNQAHLFNVAETELKYTIQNSRETQLNEQHIKLMRLSRDLESLNDELHEMIINYIEKDSKVDFHDHKMENTLLIRKIKLELADCTNKIGTKILGNTKSDIENLRWHTTKTGLLAVIILVFFIVSGVSISRRITADNEKPLKVILHTVDKEENDDADDELME